jgi:preprotein translocase subunit SecG
MNKKNIIILVVILLILVLALSYISMNKTTSVVEDKNSNSESGTDSEVYNAADTTDDVLNEIDNSLNYIE